MLDYPLLFRLTFSDTHVNRPNGESAASDWSAEEEYEPILPGAKHKLTARLQKAQKMLQEEIIELKQKSKMRQSRERNKKRRVKYAEKKRLAAEAAREVVGQGEEEDADDEDEGDEATAQSETPEYVRQIRKETAKYAEFDEVSSEEE
jgi:uncharacterized protein YlxW (UPF0749 family)